MQLITDEVLKLEDYIHSQWNFFQTELEVPLKNIFQEPENNGLQHIWQYGSADLVVRRNNKILCIIEPGGGHHFEEKQSLNDRRKWKLCDINNVSMLSLMNGVFDRLSNRQKRKLLGRYLFGLKIKDKK